jgi:Cys-tRNA(Pro)/Cys-tRNA(Cys) deacylase
VRIPATPATRALDLLGVKWTGHVYDHDPRERNFGQEAAEALGLDPHRVFKTLVVSIEGQGLAVAILPVSDLLDLRAFAGALGGKRADLAEIGAAERTTGYVHGGISPIGQRRALPTVIDQSAMRWSTIFVSGGRRGFDLELSPSDLLAVTGASCAEIVRGDGQHHPS